ncbi:MAG: outer membrane protein assembly factor BamD [Candidatus Omnitrophica bacterium]|nr:outer membrane protein assembly factor BamD [Candidatus Omnitrophota bacterium]
MRKIICLLTIILAISFIPAQNGFCFWIWTPKTGKWVNPKYAPKPTPKEQLEYALSFYKENKYKEAERELNSLLKYYPKSAEAAEAQYYLGLVYEAEEKYYEAYKSYQKVVDKYPFSERIQEIIEREFKIAEKFMSGEKRKFAGMPLPVENPSIEIFQKVIDNSQYGPLAPLAQYKLGLVLMGLERFLEAQEAFEKVLSNYPNSEWTAAAKYQLGLCQARQSQGIEYDQVAMQEAKDKFEEFIQEHPEAALSKEAEKNIAELKDKEAEANFNTAVFYEKQKAYAAAKIYYETVVTNYPQSRWVKLAQEKIKEMEERLGGKKKIKNVLKEIQREERLKLSQAKKAEKLAKLEQKRKERQERLRLAKEEKKRKKQAGQPANASPIKTEPESQEDTTLTNE